jgi:hypothetical protein
MKPKPVSIKAGLYGKPDSIKIGLWKRAAQYARMSLSNFFRFLAN